MNTLINEDLKRLAEKNKNIFVLSSDYVGKFDLNDFAKENDGRFFRFGLGVDNMISVAAGMASRGKVPFVLSSALTFLKTQEQIRNDICFSNLNVKLVGLNYGFHSALEGEGAQVFEDVAVMRALPGMEIYSPGNADEMLSFFSELGTKNFNPAYLRLSPGIFEDNIVQGLNNSGDADICLFVTSTMTKTTNKVAEKMRNEGFSVKVVNVSRLKPVMSDLILNEGKNCKICVSIEEHSVIGGLGDIIADLFCKNDPKLILKIGMEDQFSDSGDIDALYRKYKLDSESVYERIKTFINHVNML